MLSWFFLLLYSQELTGYGYDSGGEQASCGRPYRSGRMHQPPCDLSKQGFCASAGTTYPWHAVRRFVKDNQGLMRRMYGDQRHGHVLGEEIDELRADRLRSRFSRYQHDEDIDNDVFPYEEEYEGEEARFLRDDVTNEDVLKTRFVFSEEPVVSIKLAALKTAPYFRPTTQKATPATEEATARTEGSESDATTEFVTTEGTPVDVGFEDVSTARGDEAQTEASQSVGEKTETMLFQDVEHEETKKKVHVNYKVKGINACPVKEEVVAPFWANNTRGEVLALLNMYPFEQYVHWEKCTYEHRQMYCREGCRCEQQYRLHRLLAYDPNNECRGIFSDWFRFPSCCVCKCYDMPAEFRLTSRSPRFKRNFPGEG